MGKNVPDVAGKHQIWTDNAAHLYSRMPDKLCHARADRGEKGKKWNPVKVQVKLFMAETNATNDNSYNFSLFVQGIFK